MPKYENVSVSVYATGSRVAMEVRYAPSCENITTDMLPSAAQKLARQLIAYSLLAQGSVGVTANPDHLRITCRYKQSTEATVEI